jgi:hypothetical protein
MWAIEGGWHASDPHTSPTLLGVSSEEVVLRKEKLNAHYCSMESHPFLGVITLALLLVHIFDPKICIAPGRVSIRTDPLTITPIYTFALHDVQALAIQLQHAVSNMPCALA